MKLQGTTDHVRNDRASTSRQDIKTWLRITQTTASELHLRTGGNKQVWGQEASAVITMLSFLLENGSKSGKILWLLNPAGQPRVVHFLSLYTSLHIWNIYNKNSTFRGSFIRGILHVLLSTSGRVSLAREYDQVTKIYTLSRSAIRSEPHRTSGTRNKPQTSPSLQPLIY